MVANASKIMLKWCSYCQDFIGEVPDYENLDISHGICWECRPKTPSFSTTDFERARLLKGIQRKLFVAGQRNDLNAAEAIIADAAEAGIKPVNVLIGTVAPLLYRVGEDWKRGTLSVEEEHRFTAFCERTYYLVAENADFGTSMNSLRASDAQDTEFLLLNAPGNRHTLAIRILALALASRGMRARIADGPVDPYELVATIDALRPGALLVSMALAEQSSGVVTITQRVESLPKAMRPKIIVGGYAVKLGLVSHIPGAVLMPDISALFAMP